MTTLRAAFGMLSVMCATVPEAASATPVQVSSTTFAAQLPRLSEQELGQIRGGYGYQRGTLTEASMTTILSAQSELEFRSAAAVGAVIMDNWWNDYGAQLIVTSLTTPR